ncbi:MAG: glycine cleavage system protein GcvH [Chloroflexota bacterium]
MNIPSDLRYTANDEWIKVEGNLGTVGITDYAQEQLSDVVYVEFFVEEGTTIKQGEAFAVVESVKAAADIYSPVSGLVTSINEALMNTPETVNDNPYGEAWMIKLEISNPSELDKLLDASAYEKHCQERAGE